MENNVQQASTLARAIRIAIAVSAFGACTAAVAGTQSEPPQAASSETPQVTTMEEVNVTAQRRRQNIQEVPIAVSVISPAVLDTQRIESVSDIGKLVPSMNITRSGKVPSIFLRGIGNNSASPGQEQNIALYVDGVYYPSLSADVFSFDNLERIEVLRGPQGTLFGRNSTGGVIQIVTQDPTQDTEGRFSAGYGNYDLKQASAFISGGIADNLAANFGVRWSDQGEGWGRNVYDGKDVNLGRDVSVRTKVVFTPEDGTKLTLGGFYSRTAQDFGSSRQMLPGTPTLPPGFDSIDFTGSIYDRNANYPSLDTTKQHGANLRLDQNVGFADLVSISAYMVTDATQRSDVDQSPIDRLHVESLDRTRSFSQEVQLQSRPDSPFQWVTGLYYFNATAGNIPQQQAGSLIGVGTYRDIWGIQKTESYSGFGQATFPVFDDLTKLTLGLRYTADDKSLKGRIETPAGVTTTASASDDWNNLTYRVALDRQLTDKTLAYASVSTGFKSGVYNVVSITSPPVAPEHLTDYEIGMKTELFDRRLRLNTAAFYYDYKDIQLLRQLGPTTLIQNAANAQLYGLEVEATAAPVDGLMLNLGLSLMKDKYLNFKDAVANTPGSDGLGVTRIFDATGNKLQRTPGSTVNFGVDYTWRTSVGGFGAGVNAYYNGGFFWDPENRLKQKAYTLADANLRWHSSESGLQVQLWAKNIFDKQYYSYVTSSRGSPDTGAPGAPRTFGISFSYDL